MKLPEKYLDTYNLHQACLYIAFGYKTMTEEAENLHRKLNNRIPPLCAGNYLEYKKYMSAASDMLIIALKDGKITATTSGKPVKVSEKSSIKLFIEDNVTDFVCDNKRYENAEISADELHKTFQLPLFPFNPRNTFEYTTEYLDIIYEIIAEEQISETNQGKADALAALAKQKMKQRGLIPSDKLATSIATIIRKNSSQKGNYKRH